MNIENPTSLVDPALTAWVIWEIRTLKKRLGQVESKTAKLTKGICAGILLAVICCGCSTVFPKTQAVTVDPLTGTAQTNQIAQLNPAVREAVKQVGSVFGPIGDLAASLLLGGSALGVALYNRKKKP